MTIGRFDLSWSVEDTIEQLENVAAIPPKQRHTDLGELVKTIVSHAYDKGLEAPNLEKIVRILTSPASSRHIDQSNITSLVKNLYPSPGSLVSSRTITRIVACLGPGKTTKPSPTVQFLLLRWLVLIHDNGLETRAGSGGRGDKLVQDPAHIARLYSALFDNLDMLTLRRPLCHLLALITRRRHVTPARVRVLMGLVREASGDEEKALLELFRIYKSYYPDLIILPFGSSATAMGRGGKGMYLFKHPDVEWARHVLELRQARDQGVSQSSQRQSLSLPSFSSAPDNPAKRRRIEVVIPSLKTSRLSSANFASLEELRDAKEFARRFERIEVPNQMVAALGDPLAQRYVQLSRQAKPEIMHRLETWLDAFFTDQLDILQMEGTEEESGDLGIVLQALLGYTRVVKALPDAAVRFFRRYLLLWNGSVNSDIIFGLLEYIRPDGFDALFASYFRPLERAILDGSTESKVVLLRYYASLLRRWTVLLRSSTTNDIPILKVAEHAETLALVILESPPTRSDDTTKHQQSSPSLSVLDFYEILAHLYAATSTLPNIADQMTIPPTPTPYLFTLTPTLTHISSMTAIAALYKQTFENLLAAKIAYPPSVIAQFNGYVMDTCNLLWRNRALNTQDSNAKGCLLPRSIFECLTRYIRDATTRGREGSDQYQLTAAFSLSRNFALCGVAAACMRDLQTKEGRLEWQEFRPRILDWLDQRGAEGIGRLMRISMKALRK